MLRLIAAETPEHWKEARRLLERYAASLDFDLDFQDFIRELDLLPGDYTPPDGAFLLALQSDRSDRFVGCVALRKCSDRTCEMKRLYVGPDQRSQGIGRSLVEAIIAAAARLGYERMLLDTVPSMQAARRLYASLGFTPTEAYRYNPIPGATFMELCLR